MKSLNELSNINKELSNSELEKVVGGKKKPWWWSGLEGLGQVAEAGSSIWHIIYP